MAWLIVLCVILSVLSAVLIVKIILLRRAADEIRLAFSEKLVQDTNTLIAIPTNDRAMRRLANDINAQLRELQRQRHRFVLGDMELKNAVTNISHDLRTPLTAISSYLDLLDKAEKSDTVQRYIDVIRNRTDALSQLTEELFCYSVILSPQHDTSTELICVNKALEESLLEYYAALQEHQITPQITMTEKKIIRELNQADLSRTFSNLLGNAIKYSDGDLSVELTEDGKIIFSNTASSLSEVQVEKIFDRFYTLENAGKGTGLGLSIARMLIRQMGGEITAEYAGNVLSICILLPENGNGQCMHK